MASERGFDVGGFVEFGDFGLGEDSTQSRFFYSPEQKEKSKFCQWESKFCQWEAKFSIFSSNFFDFNFGAKIFSLKFEIDFFCCAKFVTFDLKIV